jgi:hypothetical protein
VGAPTLISEIVPTDPKNGTIFRVGRFVHGEREIIVTELHMYHLGAAASTTSSTEDSDLFIDDLLAWLSSHFQVLLTPYGERAYSSQLEFRLNKPLPEYFPHLASLGLQIPQFLSNFWPTKPAYEVTSVTLSFDPNTKLTGLGNFRIERREGTAFDANLYWSEAPLQTKQHLLLLESFERST